MLHASPDLAHVGTALRIAPWFALLALAACNDEQTPRPTSDDTPDARVDARDAGTADASSDAGTADAANPADATPTEESTCTQTRADFQTFLAENSACTNDADCKIIGDCGHADFRAITASAYDEGQELATGSCFTANDGPGYYAICSAGKCERALGDATYGCGVPSAYACQPGALRVTHASCGSEEPAFTSGCLLTCENGEACPQDTECRTFDHDPCADPGPNGGGASGACPTCEGVAVKACLPRNDCEVVVSIDVARDSYVRLGGTPSIGGPPEAFELEVVLVNRSTSAKELTLTAPCLGPEIDGLGGYDVWKSCLAGACAPNTPPVTLTLAAGERKTWRSAIVSTVPDDCNADGIAVGEYTPTTALEVTGANVCSVFTSVVSVQP